MFKDLRVVLQDLGFACPASQLQRDLFAAGSGPVPIGRNFAVRVWCSGSRVCRV